MARHEITYFQKIKGVLDRFISDNIAIIVIISVFLVSQLIFASAPFVNFEYPYAEVGKIIAENPLGFKMSDFGFYVNIYANPILTSFFIAVSTYLFGFSEFTSRLPVILISVIFLSILYWVVKRFFPKRIAIYCVIFTAVNPLFWNWGGMAYTDVPFSFLVFLGLVFLYIGIDSSRWIFFLLSAFFLCLSFLTKYIGALFFVFAFLFLFLYNFKKYSSRSSRFSFRSIRIVSLKTLSQYSPFVVLFIMLCISYVFWVIDAFGFIISESNTQIVFWSLGTFFKNFIAALGGYLMWFGAFCGLVGFFSLVNIIRRFGKVRFYFIISALFVADMVYLLFIHSSSLGELDFGFLDSFIPSSLAFLIRLFLLLLGELITLDMFFFTFRFEKQKLFSYLIRWTIIFTLVSFSMVRPAQRYILFLIPVFALYCVLVAERRRDFIFIKRFALILTIIVFASACLTISVYKFNLGVAAANIADYINENNLEAGLDWEPRAHLYYLLDDKNLYPADNINLALRDKNRPFYSALTGMIDLSEYAIVYSQPVEVFGIKVKEFSVAEKIV